MKERERPKYADYADCIDDDYSIVDDDDTVCDDERDGLLPEEVKAYQRECQEMRQFQQEMISKLGYNGYGDWKRNWR